MWLHPVFLVSMWVRFSAVWFVCMALHFLISCFEAQSRSHMFTLLWGASQFSLLPIVLKWRRQSSSIGIEWGFDSQEEWVPVRKLRRQVHKDNEMLMHSIDNVCVSYSYLKHTHLSVWFQVQHAARQWQQALAPTANLRCGVSACVGTRRSHAVVGVYIANLPSETYVNMQCGRLSSLRTWVLIWQQTKLRYFAQWRPFKPVMCSGGMQSITPNEAVGSQAQSMDEKCWCKAPTCLCMTWSFTDCGSHE